MERLITALVLVQDLFDTSALLNTEMLPLMRYIISEEEMARFTQGRMSADEQERFMAKLQSSMLRSSEESAHAHAAKLRVESEPNYAVEDVLFNTPQANQPPVPSAGDAMEALKAELVSTYGMVRSCAGWCRNVCPCGFCRVPIGASLPSRAE